VSEGAQKKPEKPRKFQAIRGTRDLLHPDTALWNRVEQTAHEVFNTYGYGEIRPPIFEPTELFSRAVGGDTDIVSKEMYTFSPEPLTRLDALRALILSAKDYWGGSDYPPRVNEPLQEFVNVLKSATSRGAIPGTPENIADQAKLESLGNRLDQLINVEDRPDIGEVNDLCEQAEKLVESLQFQDAVTLHRTQHAAVAAAGEAVLHGANVPARATAERSLPPILSNWGGNPWRA
jgi:hypothetical protein